MFISNVEVNSKRKLKGVVSGEEGSDEGKNRSIIFRCEPCTALILESYMHIVTLLKICFKFFNPTDSFRTAQVMPFPCRLYHK